MQRHDAALARLAAGQIGLATRPQVRELGLSDEEIKALLACGVLERLHRGVLRHAAVPLTTRSWLLAAVLAGGSTAVASHRSAAALHGFDVRRARPEITVCDTTLPRLSGVTIHRTNLLEPIDVTRTGGIPCTSRARTALDVASVLPWERYEEMLQVVVIEKRLDLADLVAVLERVGGRGRRGTAKLRAFLLESVPDARLASVLEHLVHEIVRQVDAPPPELQHRVVCDDGRVVILDMAWPGDKVTIEPAGHRWHATRKQLDDDEARRRSIKASGWDHNVFTWSDARERTASTRAEIVRILRSLSRSGW